MAFPLASRRHSPACWYLQLSPVAYRAHVQVVDPLLGGDVVLSVSATPVVSLAVLMMVTAS